MKQGVGIGMSADTDPGVVPRVVEALTQGGVNRHGGGSMKAVVYDGPRVVLRAATAQAGA